MVPIKTVFACTDFSAAGNNAIEYAIGLAADTKTNLVIFHVGTLPKFKPTISEREFQILEQNEEEKNEKKLSQLVFDIVSSKNIQIDDNKIKVMSKTGMIASDTILMSTKKLDADLLILGTHGATGLRLFGSTSANIVLRSSIPVLAIPTGHSYKKIEDILYASDLRSLVPELDIIIPFAQLSASTIEIFHLDVSLSNLKLVDNIKTQVDKINYDKVRITIQKDQAAISLLEQIQHYSNKQKPDILVMFPEGRSVFDRLFGRGKTEELTYSTNIPLLTLKKIFM